MRLAAHGFDCSGLRGIRFTATHHGGSAIEVELRTRAHIKRDNMYADLHLCFPIRGEWHLIPHDKLVEIAGETTSWLSTYSWRVVGEYNSENPSRRMVQRLDEFRIGACENRSSPSPGMQPPVESHLSSRDRPSTVLRFDGTDAPPEAGPISGQDNVTTPLHDAARLGHTDTVWALVSAGADVNARDEKGTTPLHRAVQRSNAKMVEMLISAGADVNAQTDNGMTSLHVVAETYDAEIAEALISTGADVNAREEKDITPLHMATQVDNVEAVHALLSAGADVNAREERGVTPIFIAVDRGYAEMVRTLAYAGANVDVRLENNFTPLHQAVHKDNSEMVQALIAVGADVNAGVEIGWTPLLIAVRAGNTELAKVLVSADADVNVPDDEGWYPCQQRRGHRRPGSQRRPRCATRLGAGVGRVSQKVQVAPSARVSRLQFV